MSALSAACLLALAGCTPPQSDSAATPSVAEIQSETERILDIDDRLERVEQLAGFLQRLPKTAEAAEKVTAGVSESSLDRGDIELVLVAEWWTPFAPMEAFGWSRKDWRADHPRIAYAVLRRMALDDPQKAIDAYHSIKTNHETYAIYLQPIIVGWHESGRPGIIPFIVSQPNTQLQQLALGTLARRQVLALGPEKAIEWAEAIAGDQGMTVERQIFQRIASSIAELEPEAAAAWVEDLVKKKGASETLLRRVSGRWARRNGPAAMEWLARFESSDHQKQAVSQTFNLWSGREPEAAREWLEKQGEAQYTWLAPATVATIKSTAREAKDDATIEVDWKAEFAKAARVTDEESRWGVMTQLGRVWITRDESAARAFLDSIDLPENYRAKIEAAVASESLTPRS